MVITHSIVFLLFVYNLGRAFNIFQVNQYFTIYRQYFWLEFEQFHEYLIQHSLKSRGTKDHFRQVKVPGTTPYWKVWLMVVVKNWNPTLPQIENKNKTKNKILEYEIL